MKEPNVKETGGRRDWGFGVGELHPMVEAFFKSNPGVKAGSDKAVAPMNKGGGKRKSKKRKSKKRKSKRKKSKKSRKRSKTRRRR